MIYGVIFASISAITNRPAPARFAGVAQEACNQDFRRQADQPASIRDIGSAVRLERVTQENCPNWRRG
jgi:hypothetical protein